jgi:hypothetical protein
VKGPVEWPGVGWDTHLKFVAHCNPITVKGPTGAIQPDEAQ